MNDSIEHSNSGAFDALAWISFAVSSIGTILGVIYLPVEIWIKAYLGMGYLFTITSCFTVAKVVRDKQEAQKVINRIKSAKTEKLLHEYEKVV